MRFKNIFRSNYFIIITGVLIITLVFNFYLFNAHKFGHPGLGQFGDLYGGVIGTIVSAITLFYLIITVEEIKTQNKYIRKQIEQSDFMMLLHNYHEIIEDLDYDLKNENNEIKQVLHGREAMKEILKIQNHDEIDMLKHIVATAVYILKFPSVNKDDTEYQAKKLEYNKAFIPTLSESEKIAILRVEKNDQTIKSSEGFNEFASTL